MIEQEDQDYRNRQMDHDFYTAPVDRSWILSCRKKKSAGIIDVLLKEGTGGSRLT
jgi:hypothetical protein